MMAWYNFAFFLLALTCTVASSVESLSDRSFTVDYEGDTFLKDGEPFRYISCTLHYFQIPYELWRDRISRVKALGCNVLQTYIMWSMHEPYEDQEYVFEREANVSEFLSLAHEAGLLVIIRPGPFINAEMDFGGFPYWLLKKKDVVLRASTDRWYVEKAKKWMDYVLPTIVKPMLYENGGPIILVQVENEYGGDPNCDKKYMEWMRDIFRQHLGNDTVLITTDPPFLLQCGHVDGVLPTIDFGCLNKQDVKDSFSMLRQFLPKGPLVNSEFYPGWLTVWGDSKQNTTPVEANLATMRFMWDMNVTSFNIYPAHGGTNWGYTAGGKYDSVQSGYKATITGYDFDAPISESGDTSPKFVPMRQTIEELTGRKIPYPVPESPPKYAYGRVRMEFLGTIFDLMHSLTPPNRVIQSEYPLTMEELDQPYGFVIYETVISKPGGILETSMARDRAHIVINGQLANVTQRSRDDIPNILTINLAPFQQSSNETKIRIVTENQGRIGYGDKLKDPKGLLNNVTVDGQVVTNWTMYPIDLSLVHTLKQTGSTNSSKSRDRANKHLPSVYFGHLTVNSSLGDTFFDPSGWGKGQLFINGRNIGRYWPQAGPQITLYVPNVYISPGVNQVSLLELDQPGNCGTEKEDACYVSFGDKAIYN